MLNTERIRLMTRLAAYEQNEGKEDFKINEYYRKDYTGFHTLCSVIWVTIGYVCLIGLIAIAGMEFILAHISQSMLITMGLIIVTGYFVVVIIYTLIASHVYDRKHRAARQRMKIFNHNLTRLLKMYDKEKR